MHSLMCILVYAAQQNPMLVPRNDAGLASSGKHSGFWSKSSLLFYV